MLATFVIGLREGLEAALIVGIVAAFLKAAGRADKVRYVWYGVGIAVAICTAIAVLLQVVSANLPQRQQEMLETVIGLVAVALVTYMVIWMRQHARTMKKHLEMSTKEALATGSAWALVGMAFLAVMREGFETAVFLLAAFQASTAPLAAGLGALLGVLVAAVLGWLIYRGGLRLNLTKFFTLTGLVLVIVAAGLLASAAHTAHEAGWLEFGQAQALDLTWLVRPGTILASVLTGVLGLLPKPVVAEVVVYFAYLVPMVLYVLWPVIRPPARTPARTLAPTPEPAPHP
jgi:high-affinity iron transporter